MGHLMKNHMSNQAKNEEKTIVFENEFGLMSATLSKGSYSFIDN